MTLHPEYRQAALILLIEKAERNFQQAKANAQLGYWDLVANRLYYSIFHAVTALIMNDGITVKSHKGTSSVFGKYYVLTGKFPREAGIHYSQLQTMREKADYQNTFVLSEEEGGRLIKNTRLLLDSILSYIADSKG